jgi:hypothetical protein
MDAIRAAVNAWPQSRANGALYETAIALALPMVEHAMRDPSYGDSGFLHIVVLDSDGGELCAHSVGDPEKWDADYAAFARRKAERSLRTQADDEEGAAWLDGTAVGVSGAFPCFDQVYAGTVALWIQALTRRSRETAQ